MFMIFFFFERTYVHTLLNTVVIGERKANKTTLVVKTFLKDLDM